MARLIQISDDLLARVAAQLAETAETIIESTAYGMPGDDPKIPVDGLALDDIREALSTLAAILDLDPRPRPEMPDWLIALVEGRAALIVPNPKGPSDAKH